MQGKVILSLLGVTSSYALFTVISFFGELFLRAKMVGNNAREVYISGFNNKDGNNI